MSLRLCWFSLKNFRDLASLKYDLGQTWSQHSQKMALTYPKDCTCPNSNLESNLQNPENIRALASLEVKLEQQSRS